jgi:hypothetical protein
MNATEQTEPLSERIVRGLFVQYETGLENVHGDVTTRIATAQRGDIIHLTREQERRLEGLNMLFPKGMSMQEAEDAEEAKLDAYRGERGDQQAQAKAMERARRIQPLPADGIDNFDESSQVAGVALWMRNAKPTVDVVISMAEGDAAKAQTLLEAEELATGGNPRKGVAAGLRALIGEPVGASL